MKEAIITPEPDQVLDAKGLNCPLPILKTKLALQRMEDGEILHVMATDPHAVVDFKAYCARTGHEIIHLIETDEVMEFYIQRQDIKK
ncbi:MAG: sulfurtransferase TusA family protein [Gammaproteobacteria bacterium]